MPDVHRLGILLVSFALAGCAGSSAVVPPQDAQGRYVITLTLSNTFDPPIASVPLGATVVWAMGGNTTHDVDVYAPGAEFSTFNSGDAPPDGLGRLMQEGDAFVKRLDQKGEWRTYCHTHHYQEMRGTITVG